MKVPTDDELIQGMMSADPAMASLARKIFNAVHANDPQPKEPAHCSECFEGCPKCQG